MFVLTAVSLRGNLLPRPPSILQIGGGALVCAASYFLAVLAPALLGVARVLALGESQPAGQALQNTCQCSYCADLLSSCVRLPKWVPVEHRQPNGLVFTARHSLCNVRPGRSCRRIDAEHAVPPGPSCCPHGHCTAAGWRGSLDDGGGSRFRLPACPMGVCCNPRCPEPAKGQYCCSTRERK